MGEDKDDKPVAKTFQTYSLLQMKMKEVEKKKKVYSGDKPPNRQKEKREEFETSTPKDDVSSSKSSRQDIEIIPEENMDPDVPDRSFGDLYCKTCDSHMNSEAMWEAHVTGKKHRKNVKKGINESKYEDLPNEESSLKYELRNVKDPIIGLNYIEELRKFDPAFPPLYNCYLCHSNLATLPLLIEHVISAKHQLNFMRENKPKEYQLITAAGLKKGQLEPLVAEKAALLEEEYGRGNVIVRREKYKTGTNSKKRGYDSSDDEAFDNFVKKQNKISKPGDNSNWGGLEQRKTNLPKFEPKENKNVYDRDEYNRPRNFYRDDVEDSRSSIRSIDKEREEHFRNSLTKDYSRRYTDYGKSTDDYTHRPYANDSSRSSSSTRDYDRSHERYASSREDLHSSTSLHDNLRDSRSLYRQDKSYLSSVTSAAREESSRSSAETRNPLKEFINQLFSMSQEYFLKIALMKLKDALQSKHKIGRTELDILAQIYDVTRKLICSNLPPGFQTLLNENRSSSAQSSSVATPASTPAVQFSINDITELLRKAREPAQSVLNQSAQQSFSQNNSSLPGNFTALNSFLRPTETENVVNKFGLGTKFLEPGNSSSDKLGASGNFPGTSSYLQSSNFSGSHNNAPPGSFGLGSNLSRPQMSGTDSNLRPPDNFAAPGNVSVGNFPPAQTNFPHPQRFPSYPNLSSTNNIPGLGLPANDSTYNPNFRRF